MEPETPEPPASTGLSEVWLAGTLAKRTGLPPGFVFLDIVSSGEND